MRVKRQHFVPQHYLRQFRIEGTKQVAIATVAPFRFIGAGAINRQCQEDYFYGQDGILENLIGATETDIAPVIVRVSQTGSFNPEQLDALRMMAVILRARTRKAAESYKVFEKYIAYEVIQNAIETGKLPPPSDGKWSEEMIDFKGVPGLLIQSSIPCFMEMQTLACKLLKAPRGSVFITSDHPVPALNQFCAGVEPHRSFVGFGRSGFQLIMPIGPGLCVFFFDPRIYKIGNRRERVVEISAGDVEIINALQVQAAEKCLYFHDLKLEPHVKRLVADYTKLRIPIRDLLQTIPGRNANEQVLHFRQESVRLPQPWRFCRYQRHIRCQPGDRRNPVWSELITRFIENFMENPVEQDMAEGIDRLFAQSPRENN